MTRNAPSRQHLRQVIEIKNFHRDCHTKGAYIMSNSLQLFEHENFTARTIEDNGEIWIVAKDVAQSLGYSEASLNQTTNLFKAVPKIWADHKRINVRSENGVEQEREMLCLTEQGLYFFLGRSDKKAALPYQMWIAGEVVPSIRKHGIYMTTMKAEEIISNPDIIIKLAEEVKENRILISQMKSDLKNYKEAMDYYKDWAIEAEEEKQKNQPKVIFADAVNSSKDSILIGNLAKLLRQNGINIGSTRLFEWLRMNGYLCSCKGERWNMPTQRSIDKGLFDVKKVVINNPDGSIKITHTTKVTGKGQIFFINGFLDGSLTC